MPMFAQSTYQANLETALIVEDDLTYLDFLSQIISNFKPEWQVYSCQSVESAAEFLNQAKPNLALVLTDLGLPDSCGTNVIEQIHQYNQDVPILAISMLCSERHVLQAIRKGAKGYLLKTSNTEQIIRAITELLNGHYPISPSLARYLFRLAEQTKPAAQELSNINLSPKELELLKHLANGYSYAEAAVLMSVALSTVQTHIRNLYKKLSVHSQVQAILKATELGVL